MQCPVYHNQGAESFLVVVHNPSVHTFDRLVEVLLPTSNYTAQAWSREKMQFTDVRADIFEQQAWNKNGTKYLHYKIYIEASIPGDSVGIFKIDKVNEMKLTKPDVGDKNTKTEGPLLNVTGFTELGQVLFNYQNSD